MEYNPVIKRPTKLQKDIEETNEFLLKVKEGNLKRL